MTTPQTPSPLPFPLVASPEHSWQVDVDAAVVTARALPHSDIFVDPGAGASPDAKGVTDAATLLGLPPEGDFQLGARVTVDFAATFDAGVLLLWVDERHWGKLCFEYSPDGEPMIVSVVARGVADDANAFGVDGRSAWLRVSRIGRAYAYHASVDGRTWRMVRFFALADPEASVRVGFEAQSPTGEGCTVTFDQIRFSTARLADLRDGS